MNRRILAVTLLLASSCHTWELRPATPLGAATDSQPATLRITRHDDSQVVLRDATILADSVRGRREAGFYRYVEHGEPLSNVQRVEVRQFDVGATGAIVTILVALAVGTGIFMWHVSETIN